MRRALDAYFTPELATKAMLKRVSIFGTVLEPCSGDGAIAKVIAAKGFAVHTNDLNRAMPALTHQDATDPGFWKFRRMSWVISNPPFLHAPKILPLAYKHAGRGVVMLLRLSYLEPCAERGSWLADHPPNGLLVLPRISFTGDGKTDSVTCAWFVWEKNCRDQWIEIETKAQFHEQPDAPLLEMSR